MVDPGPAPAIAVTGLEWLDYISVPLDSVPIDKRLDYSIYLNLQGRFVRLREESEALSCERVRELRARNVEAIYIPKTQWVEFIRQVESFCVPTNTGIVDLNSSMLWVRQALVAHLRDGEEKSELTKPLFQTLKRLTDRLVQSIHTLPSLAARMWRRSSDPQLYFPNHSVNVAIGMASFASTMNLGIEQMKLAGLSGLLHNVGNWFVSRDLLYGSYKFDDAQIRSLRLHPVKGSNVLTDVSAPAEAILTAMQHHEKCDGTGYPGELTAAQIHLFPRMCAVLDVYDAIRSNRVYEAGKTRTETFQVMNKLKRHFDPSLLAMLIDGKIETL